MANIGSWTIAGLPTPDYGISEALARLLGRPQNNLVPDVLQAPKLPTNNFQSVLGASTSSDPYAGAYSTPPIGPTYSGPQTKTPSGGSNITAPTGQTGDNGQGVANLGLAAALANAQSYRDRGLQTFNDLIKSVNDFRNRASDLRSAGEQTITNQTADTLGSNAKTAQQLAGAANAQGRNLGLSSKVNLGQRLLGNLEGTQGNVLAKKGENLTANENLYQSRQDQANAQEAQANQYKQGIESGVNQIQAGGLADYTGALQAIQERANALASLNPLNAGGLSGYSPDFSGITNTLNSVIGSIPSVTGSGANTNQAVNLVTDPTFQAYLRKYAGTYNPNKN